MRYLNTVYVRDHRARVRHRHGSLLVSSPDGSQRIPLEAIDAVVMFGGAQVTTQALEACVRRGVRVTALQMSGAVRFVVSNATGGNVHLRASLYRAISDEAHSLALSKAIVAAKLQNSRKVVDRWARDEKDPDEADRLAAARHTDLGKGFSTGRRRHGQPCSGHRRRCRENLFRCSRSSRIQERYRVLEENSAAAPRPGQCHARVLLRLAGDRVHRRG